MPKDYRIVKDDIIKRDGFRYRRLVAHTPWLKGKTDLAEVVEKALGDNLHNGGTVFISEKVAIVAAGEMVPASSIKVGPFARFASKFVRPIGQDLAQAIPERMQFVIDMIGFPRTFLACAASALTKPFGIRGAFFVVAGYQARDLDGMHGEYMDWLLPPLKPKVAQGIVDDIAKRVGAPVAIVDVNDRGGHTRAVSKGGLSDKHMVRALKDNPMDHKDTSTPIGMVQLLESDK